MLRPSPASDLAGRDGAPSIRQTVVVAIGTRPEAIKMAPVIMELQARPREFDTRVLSSGQHGEAFNRVLELFGISPDHELAVMRPGESLSDLTARALAGSAAYFRAVDADVVLVQGDTSTTLAAGVAAFYSRCALGHVEGGLRTFDLERPFPEEGNRQLVTRLARWHFAPTAGAAQNLLDEGVSPTTVHVTGNTVVDALLHVAAAPHTFCNPRLTEVVESGRRLVLVTAHRRENWGGPMEAICRAVGQIADSVADIHVLFAVHMNPAVAALAQSALSHRSNVDIIAPQDYGAFVALMRASTLILSDSGGIQEEAPALGRPVLVLRDVTERPEAVAAGGVRLVGTDTSRIVGEAVSLLTDPSAYALMTKVVNPFGDGHAAERIVGVLAADASSLT
jgi:UDP-N-acetylglucosamine 2-epimerase (non-hydrolysing)